MPAPRQIADKTLTSLLGASVAINGFFATRAFSLLDSLDKRQSVAETSLAVTAKIDDFQNEKLTDQNQRILALEAWYAKVKKEL